MQLGIASRLLAAPLRYASLGKDSKAFEQQTSCPFHLYKLQGLEKVVKNVRGSDVGGRAGPEVSVPDGQGHAAGPCASYNRP